MAKLLSETIKLRRFSVQEYHAMAEAGVFYPNERLELIDGRIITMSPQKPLHASTTKRVGDYLRNLFVGIADIRSQLPVQLHDFSEPEPDVAVVRIDRRDYADRHPTVADIFLIVEISDSTLKFDLEEKVLDYARAGITECWVVDVKAEQLFGFRQPVDSFYQQSVIWQKDAVVSPLAFPQLELSVARFFLPVE